MVCVGTHVVLGGRFEYTSFGKYTSICFAALVEDNLLGRLWSNTRTVEK
jgi:hypothetical protein